MPAKRLISPLIKLTVLIAVAFSLYRLAHLQTETALVVPDDDDISVMPRVSVHVQKIGHGTVRETISAFGLVEPEPGSASHPPAVASITPPLNARIAEVLCSEGQRVDTGQVLFKLDSRQSDPAILLQQSATTHPANLEFVSPLSGTITKLTIHPGEVAQPSSIVEVVDVARLVLAVNIPANDLTKIKAGQRALIHIASSASSATPQPSDVESLITRVDPFVNNQTNMASVDIAVPASLKLFPGQAMHARLIIDQHENVLTVPAESIVNDAQGQPGVSIVESDLRWGIRYPVEIGLREGDVVEIRGPQFKGNETIVTTGAYALKDKTLIEVETQP